jgi:hypothetical protein
VIIDPCQVGFIFYLPQAAPSVERILNLVYRSTLLITRTEHVLFHTQQWKCWTLRDWQCIRKEFNITTVVLPNSDHLQLPILFQSSLGVNIYYTPAPEMTR